MRWHPKRLNTVQWVLLLGRGARRWKDDWAEFEFGVAVAVNGFGVVRTDTYSKSATVIQNWRDLVGRVMRLKSTLWSPILVRNLHIGSLLGDPIFGSWVQKGIPCNSGSHSLHTYSHCSSCCLTTINTSTTRIRLRVQKKLVHDWYGRWWWNRLRNHLIIILVVSGRKQGRRGCLVLLLMG